MVVGTSVAQQVDSESTTLCNIHNSVVQKLHHTPDCFHMIVNGFGACLLYLVKEASQHNTTQSVVSVLIL